MELASYDTAYATVLEALPNVTYTQPDGTTFGIADIAIIGEVNDVRTLSSRVGHGLQTFQIDVHVSEVLSARAKAVVPIAEIARFVVNTASDVTLADAKAALLNQARVFVLGSSGEIMGGNPTWKVAFFDGFWFELNHGVLESPALLRANRQEFMPDGLTIDEIRSFVATPVDLLPQYDRPNPNAD